MEFSVWALDGRLTLPPFTGTVCKLDPTEMECVPGYS